MGRVADAGVAAAWERRLARQRRSRLPVAEFCRQESVSPKSFYAWRKRLREAPPSALFVPVEVPDSVDPLRGRHARGEVRIDFPSGAVLTLPVDSPAELITMAIRAAMREVTQEERPSC